MPVNSPNQGIPEQQGADPANLPVAQVAWDGVMENRLVQRYASIADRTARNPAPNEGELSHLADVDRIEVFDSANWISAYARSMFSVTRNTGQNLTVSSTVLQNVTNIAVALPAAGRFVWRAWAVVSGVVAADIKFAYTWPGGATVRWGLHGLDVAAGTTFISSAQVASGTATPVGLLGAVAFTMITFEGEITMGGAGTLQCQAAQNTADPTASVIQFMRQELWREA